MTIRSRNITYIVLGALLLLLVPLFAMQLGDDFNWGLFDFVIAFILLVAVGLCYELIIKRLRDKTLRRVAVIMGVLTFVLIWAELAVGIFS